jgi:hypothetical protein
MGPANRSIFPTLPCLRQNCVNKSRGCLSSPYPSQDQLKMNDTSTARYRPRALLTQKEAVEIYLCRKSRPGQKVNTSMLSRKYNISPKAIRDIWNRRTWAPETQHLWADDEFPMIRTKNSKKSLNNSKTGVHSAQWPFPNQSYATGERQVSSPCDICIDVWPQHASFPDSHIQIPADPRPDTYPQRPPAHKFDDVESISAWHEKTPATLCFSSPTDFGGETPDAVAFAAAAADDPFHFDWPYW